jgi:hypothetical protein
VKLGIELFFDSIWLKIDELNGPLRAFFEQLKTYVEKQGDREYRFTQGEVRQALNISSAGIKRFMRELVSLEYLCVLSGAKHSGYLYSIEYWDDFKKLKSDIKTTLKKQLDQ